VSKTGHFFVKVLSTGGQTEIMTRKSSVIIFLG